MPPSAVKEVEPFPSSGAIRWTRWADVVREHAPKPTPDVDIVGQAFQRWTRERNIDLTSPNIERIFIGFCRKWKLN
jgi:replication initiation protein RepC